MKWWESLVFALSCMFLTAAIITFVLWLFLKPATVEQAPIVIHAYDWTMVEVGRQEMTSKGPPVILYPAMTDPGGG